MAVFHIQTDVPDEGGVHCDAVQKAKTKNRAS